jgi:F0F1-type ATP synthase assembly protein I
MIFGGGIGLVFGQAILADVALGVIVGAGIGLVFDSIVGQAKSKNGGN